MGLWAAVKAERLGIDTLLVDAGSVGSTRSASAGLLGALMPHMPDQWNGMKQFQFEALLDLEDEIAAIEAATGMDCGYRRCGRLIPLPKPHLREIALERAKDAESCWQRQGRRFSWRVADRPSIAGWPDASFCEAGLVHETLAGRVSPRRLLAALAASLRAAKHVRIVEGVEAGRIDATASRVIFSNGENIGFGHCIVAAGHRSFALLQALLPSLPKPVGRPVKGQAALMRANIDPGLPVIFLNGLYVVAHGGGPEGGYVAIGSTSEEIFDDADSTDGRLDALIAKARAVVPLLADAPVVERWAGLRPKAIGRDPMVGPHPDHPRVIALTGGFKVSFGLAARLADVALATLSGPAITAPPSFALASHIAIASR